MATNVDLRGQGPRDLYAAQTSFISVVLDFASFAVGSADIAIGVIPAGARILRAYTVVSVVYNAGTNNGLGIGNATGGQQIAANGNTYLSALGTNAITLVASAAQFVTTPTTLWVHNNVTGTAPTTGHADVIVEYANVHGASDNF